MAVKQFIEDQILNVSKAQKIADIEKIQREYSIFFDETVRNEVTYENVVDIIQEHMFLSAVLMKYNLLQGNQLDEVNSLLSDCNLSSADNVTKHAESLLTAKTALHTSQAAVVKSETAFNSLLKGKRELEKTYKEAQTTLKTVHEKAGVTDKELTTAQMKIKEITDALEANHIALEASKTDQRAAQATASAASDALNRIHETLKSKHEKCENEATKYKDLLQSIFSVLNAPIGAASEGGSRVKIRSRKGTKRRHVEYPQI